jgi:hypothetical protein
MKPTYQVRVWQEDDWWLARVVGASEDAGPAPLNAVTQARSLARIEPMGRDLIATILDADDADFEVELEYVLPDDVDELVCQAKGARAWLDAAQDMWQEQSTLAARALTSKGYSLRETAALLGLSHQRVDQLLGGHADHEPSQVLILQCKSNPNAGSRHSSTTAGSPGVDALLVVRRNQVAHGQLATILYDENVDEKFRERFQVLASEMASQFSRLSKRAELEDANAE